MAKKRRKPWTLPALLTVARILEWADAHHARAGEWPRITTAPDPSLRFLCVHYLLQMKVYTDGSVDAEGRPGEASAGGVPAASDRRPAGVS